MFSTLEALRDDAKDVFTPKEQLFFHLWERDYRRVYWKDNRRSIDLNPAAFQGALRLNAEGQLKSFWA